MVYFIQGYQYLCCSTELYKQNDRCMPWRITVWIEGQAKPVLDFPLGRVGRCLEPSKLPFLYSSSVQWQAGSNKPFPSPFPHLHQHAEGKKSFCDGASWLLLWKRLPFPCMPGKGRGRGKQCSATLLVDGSDCCLPSCSLIQREFCVFLGRDCCIANFLHLAQLRFSSSSYSSCAPFPAVTS